MENELDLTLRLGLPVSTVETNLSLQHTPTTHDQGISVNGGQQINNDGGENNGHRHSLFGGDMDENDEGARSNVNVNIRVYNSVFQLFAGIGETLNFSPHPMQPFTEGFSTPSLNSIRSNYVLIDVPARRAETNTSANVCANANTSTRRPRGCRELVVVRKCTNRNCNASDTPMWRRGPLGPKTLCNACGIKFRKEEERRAKRNRDNGA